MRYLATYLIYVAVIARAIGWNQDTAPIPSAVWILLGIFGAILLSEPALTRRFPSYPLVYMLVQSGVVVAMLSIAPSVDFLTLLFLPLSFQVVQFFPNWIGFAWIGGFILAMAAMAIFAMEWEAGLTLLISGGVLNALMGSFALLIDRTDRRQGENQRLFKDLQEAYRQLKDSAAQAEELAAARERHRLVRELHDSLTQTLFSMNLAVQASQLSLHEGPLQAEEHLAHLQSLARDAASEVQALIGKAPGRALPDADLAGAIERLVAERLSQDGLRVSLEVSGQRVLPAPVEANLYRITREALNNVTRHAGVSQAMVRLRLEGPIASLEVEDEGCGFDMADRGHLSGFGLTGMGERAAEIGWELEIKSGPGKGTHVRVAEKAQ